MWKSLGSICSVSLLSLSSICICLSVTSLSNSLSCILSVSISSLSLFLSSVQLQASLQTFLDGVVTVVGVMETARSLRLWRRETSSLTGGVLLPREWSKSPLLFSLRPPATWLTQFVGSAQQRSHSTPNFLVRGLEKESPRRLRSIRKFTERENSGRWPLKVVLKLLVHPLCSPKFGNTYKPRVAKISLNPKQETHTHTHTIHAQTHHKLKKTKNKENNLESKKSKMNHYLGQ